MVMKAAITSPIFWQQKFRSYSLPSRQRGSPHDELAIPGIPMNPHALLSLSVERRADGDGRPMGNVAIFGRFGSGLSRWLGVEGGR
jgi:hypothetical protein